MVRSVIITAYPILMALQPCSLHAADGIRIPPGQEFPLPDRADAIGLFRSHPFGLFIHFGLYSAYGGVYQGKPVRTTYLEQIMGRAGIPQDEYLTTASAFDLGSFDADAICRLAMRAGMTQIVITAKHHDGFCMFRTRQTPHNIVDLGPTGRDPVAELAKACADHKIALGLYYSIVDWSKDPVIDWKTNDNAVSDELITYECAQIGELLTQYGPVSQLWFDMGRPTREQSRRLAETAHRLQPKCAVNGRVWNEQGDFATLFDSEISESVIREPSQCIITIEHGHWGYCSWLEHPQPALAKALEKINEISRIVTHGGCLLLNIGPRGAGDVDPYERAVLDAIGGWMRVHGEAVTGASAVDFHGQLPWGGATSAGNRLYLHLHDRKKIPPHGLCLPGLVTGILDARLLGGGKLPHKVVGGVPCVEWQPDLAHPGETPIVALELAAPPVVLPPLAEPSAGGTHRVITPYRRLNRNGAGAYAPPSLRALSYDFRLGDPGERDGTLHLTEPARSGASLRMRVFVDGKEVGNRLVEVLPGAQSIHVGRFFAAAHAPVRISLEAENDAPGAIVPITAPKALHLSDLPQSGALKP